MKQIYLWGAGDGAVEIVHLIEDINAVSPDSIEICGLVADKKPKYSSLGSFAFIDINASGWKRKPSRNAQAIITAGSPELRKKMFVEVNKTGLSLPALIHPTAVVSKDCKIEKGCIVGPHVTLSYGVHLRPNCYVSFNSSIGHHSRIGAHTVLSPGTRIGGTVICGNNAFTGLNAVVAPSVKIGSRSMISAGALVVENINAGTKVIAQKSRTIRM